MRRGWGLLLFLLLLAAPLHARPHVLVILADHLTLDDVSRPDLPNLVRMRREGETALMSPGLARKPDPVANVYATLGAGDSVRVGDVSQGRMGDALRRAGVRTALIGDADGDDTGPYRPALLFLSTPDVVDDGTVSDPTAPGGKRDDPVRLWSATQAAFVTCDLVVVHFGDFARAERENERGFLLPSAYRAHRQRALQALDHYVGLALAAGPQQVSTLYLIVPMPPLTPGGGWNQLTPVLMANPGDHVRDCQTEGCIHTRTTALLTSDTTQTDGLIAARDIAPQLIEETAPTWDIGRARVPVQMTGSSLTLAGYGQFDAEQFAQLRRLDRLTRLNQEAQNPVFWTIGLGAAALVFGCLGLSLSGRMTGAVNRAARYAMRLLCAWPLALLIAPLADPHTVPGYLTVIVALIGLLALLPTPQIIFGLTALVLVGDGLTGTTLVPNSALSEYALAGIRFYGIGNEYMGILIGGTLLLSASPRIGGWGAALLFALVTFVLSFPAFGAKAGGAVTATATFYLAWRLLQGKPITWKHGVAGIAAGFALVFLWAGIGHVLHLRRTHLETAVGALGQGRFGYILGVSLRKIGLAARVALHPGALAGLLGFALLGLAVRKWLWRQVTDYLATRPRERAVWAAGLCGCLVAVLFNDSGLVAAILILQCLALSLLHGLFGQNECASLPWMSEMSESASPSAIP